MLSGRHAVVTLLALVVAACATTQRNYPDPWGPRESGSTSSKLPAPTATLRVSTFNLQWGRQVERALTLIRAHPEVLEADLLALQEMDAEGVECVARALDFDWIYYPATLHPRTGRDFGNAILTRWPIEDEAKIVLPHLGRFRRTQRIATAATIRVGDVPIRVYSVHLGTQLEIGHGARERQAARLLADAELWPGPAIVLGDMNSRGLGRWFEARGWSWPTRDIGRTVKLWSWDHVFARGLEPVAEDGRGTIPVPGGVSDHRIVWVVLELPASLPAARPGPVQ